MSLIFIQAITVLHTDWLLRFSMGIPYSKCLLQNYLFLIEMDRKRSGTKFLQLYPLLYLRKTYDLFAL